MTCPTDYSALASYSPQMFALAKQTQGLYDTSQLDMLRAQDNAFNSPTTAYNSIKDWFVPQTYNTGGSLGSLPMPSKFNQVLSPIKTGFDIWSTWEGIKGAKLQRDEVKQQMAANRLNMSLAKAQAAEIYANQGTRRSANVGKPQTEAIAAGDEYSKRRMAERGLA